MAFELTTQTVGTKTWEQPPDLEPTGIDVNATERFDTQWRYILADDFLCTESGPLQWILLWGSLYHDAGSLGDVRLSIFADIPAGPGQYSKPGDLLWTRTYQPGEYDVAVWQAGLQEGWMNPPDWYEPAADTVCWYYRFPLAPNEFMQQGSPEQPIVYWLGVHAQLAAAPRPSGFGWKTSYTHWNDDAVWNYDPTMQDWQELRYPPGHAYAGQSIDLAFKVIGEFTQTTTKWSQPPQPYVPSDAFNGWDEYSVYNWYQIAADDWVCQSDRPVTDIHWWGSFIGWDYPYLPPQVPDAFHIAIWTDVPADPNDPTSFSHPGQVIWANTCTTFDWSFVGWDFDPRVPTRQPMNAPEATFKFIQYLDPEQWFWQQPAEHIYWISIAAIYSAGVDPQYPFGWKTRPRVDSPAPDDAVVIFDPTAPVVGSVWGSGWPIENPAGVSWDLAFELTTRAPTTQACCYVDGYCEDLEPAACQARGGQSMGPGTNCQNLECPKPLQACCFPDSSCLDKPIVECILLGGVPQGPFTICDLPSVVCPYHKWSQPPTALPTSPERQQIPFYWGWNDPSLYYGPVVGDDWQCVDQRPVTDIHWWGSYQYWTSHLPPPNGPIAFHIGIWTNVPVGPNDPLPFSHPGRMFHEYFVLRSDLNERAVGMDEYPSAGLETCFQYDFRLPPDPNAWFWQDVWQNIFWVTISAVYGSPCNGDFDLDGDVDDADVNFFVMCTMPPPQPECWRADLNGDGVIDMFDTQIMACQRDAGWPDPMCCWDVLPPPPQEPVWGWKTRQPHWNDDAVRIFYRLPPRQQPGWEFQSGEPIEDPPGVSWDTAFVLTTRYSPPPLPCKGDMNCDGRINFADINPFVLALGSAEAYQRAYPNCWYSNADCNYDGRVNFADINPFVALLGQSPPCP